MNPVLQDTIAIAVGAIGGAITRYQTGKVVTEYITHNVHPNDVTKQSYYLGWHTAFINISGSFLLGMIAGTPTIDTTEKLQTTVVSKDTIRNKTPPSFQSQTTTTTSSATSIRTSGIQLQPQQTTTIPRKPTATTAATSISTTTATAFSLSSRSKLLIGVGFCGSYTTFSTFSVDIVSWLLQGQTHKALSYLAINNIGGVAAAACGVILMKKVFGVVPK